MVIRDKLKKDLGQLVKGYGGKGKDFVLEHPVDPAHGDFSTNIALTGVGKQDTGNKGDPVRNAEGLVKSFKKPDYIEKVEVAKPGFINFWLSPKALLGELQEALKEEESYGSSREGNGKTMLVDHSHPNIAKRFGVGHLRSTIIGQAIAKLYRFLGWKVISDNFLGDWGTQFGMIIAAIKKNGLEVQKLNIDSFEKLYVEANKEAGGNPDFMDEARGWFKKLEDGDKEARKIWREVRSQSIVEFERIWKLLGVKFDYIHSESFFEDKVAQVIKDAQACAVAKKDQGATIVRIKGLNTPLILVKSDGATTYETRDLAAIKFWMQEFKPDLIVYEVGADQAYHFRQVFAASETLGYAKPKQLVHVKHGLYRLEHGKMRTRAGQTVQLEKVLKEAVERAKKLGDGGAGAAEAVGIGAVKYFDLSHHPSTDIIFNWEKMFALEGNSAPYIQYTYARCQSVLKKSAKFKVQSSEFGSDSLNAEELAILRHFYKFPEVVQEAADNFSPNLVCNFLFELAQKYNAFYNRHRILDGYERRKTPAFAKASAGRQDERRIASRVLRITNFRLALTQVTGNILKVGLGLLGIAAPKKM